MLKRFLFFILLLQEAADFRDIEATKPNDVAMTTALLAKCRGKGYDVDGALAYIVGLVSAEPYTIYKAERLQRLSRMILAVTAMMRGYNDATMLPAEAAIKADMATYTAASEELRASLAPLHADLVHYPLTHMQRLSLLHSLYSKISGMVAAYTSAYEEGVAGLDGLPKASGQQLLDLLPGIVMSDDVYRKYISGEFRMPGMTDAAYQDMLTGGCWEVVDAEKLKARVLGSLDAKH